MILTLIQNVALIVMLATLHRYVTRRLDAYPLLSKAASGILYGAVAVVGMATPFQFAPGIIYDGRSIVLSLAGVFGGPMVAAITVAISAAYRAALGGPGVAAGVATIVSSATLGVLFGRLRRRRPASLRTLDLLAFGFAVHVLMLLAQFTLIPDGAGARVVRDIGPVVITLFPLATALTARLIIEQQEREEDRLEIAREAERLRIAMKASDQGTWDYDVAAGVVRLSGEGAHILGHQADELVFSESAWLETIHPDDRDQMREAIESLSSADTEDLRVEMRLRLPDGTYRWFFSLGTVVERDASGHPTRAIGVVEDITAERAAAEAETRRLAEAELLASSSMRLLQCADASSVMDVIRDFFGTVAPDEIVVINEVTPDGDSLVTKDVLGVDQQMLAQAAELVGHEIVGWRFPVTSRYRSLLRSGRLVRVEGGLVSLATGGLALGVDRALERAFGLRDVWAMGVADDGRAYAGVHVVTRDACYQPPTGVIESFGHLCFLTLERIDAARRLRESEERFRALIEQTREGVSVGRPDGSMLVYNRAMQEISGYDKAEVEEAGWFQLVFPTEERQSDAIRLAREALEGDLPYVEVPIIRKDGTERWLSVSTTPVTIEGETYNLSIFTDVTSRKEAEQALRDSEARFRALVETAPDAIFVQTDYRIAYVNAAACRLYGATSSEQLVGTPVLDRIPEQYRDAVISRATAVTEGRQVQGPAEQRHVRLDGEEVFVETRATPIVYEGRKGAVVFVRDIAEAKRAALELEQYREHLEELVEERTHELVAANAELEQAMRAKSAFLAKMSHELRTPLNSIIGFSSILADGLTGPLTDEQRTQITMINSSGKHLLSIINDLLDFSRLEAGRAEVDARDLDPAALLSGVAELLLPLAREKGIGIAVELPETRCALCSDEGKIRQVLLNLGGNAVKYTDAGRVNLRLRCDEAGRVAFSVSDTGHGIPPELHEAIFDSFEQGLSSPGHVPMGTGLGLTISREYARLLGGDVTLESKVGVGSTFTFTLPAEGQGSSATREVR